MAEDGLKIKFGSRIFENPEEGLRSFVNQLRNAWEGEAVKAADVLKAYLDKVAKTLAERHSGSAPGGTTSSTLSSRSGRSRESIIRSVKVTGRTWDKLTGSIGGRAELLIHETGGTIKPRAGKYLTIPLPAALGTSGTPPPFARQWKNTFVAKSKAGNLIIFQKRVGGIVPLYVLKPSVKIPARLGMQKELRDQIPYFLNRAADEIVRDVTRQLGG